MTQFLILDIKATFNLLLKRPWRHQAGAISSTNEIVVFNHKPTMRGVASRLVYEKIKAKRDKIVPSNKARD